MTLLNKIVLSVLRRYWRATRGMPLEVEVCLIDAEGRVALARDNSVRAAPVTPVAPRVWHIPRTAVRRGEGMEDALCRLLKDEHGVEVGPDVKLFWLYSGVSTADGQTGLWILRHWRKLPSPERDSLAFFEIGALPDGLAFQDAARIRQAVEGRAPFEVC